MYKKIGTILVALFLVATVQVVSVGAEEEPVTRVRRPEQTQVRVQELKERSEKARNDAQEKVNERKQEATERRLNVKQDVCERKQAQLEAVVPRLSNSSVRVKDAIDKVYERVQGFYESGQLTVENYDELDAVVAERKAASEVSIAALDSATVEYDCENPSFGQQLDGYRLLVRDSRDNLKEYRSALVDLISAMRSADADQDQEQDQQSNEVENGVENE
jgi:hypothetical protein